MIYFFDIETTTEYATLEDASEQTQKLWIEKYHAKHDPELIEDFAITYQGNGPLYPEFSKVICISISYWNGDSVKIKSFTGTEEEILKGFAEMCNKVNRTRDKLCGHSVKFFDIPFLIKRFIKHKIKVPDFINTNGLKPWETGWIIDTNELWNVGSNFKTSLPVICDILGIESPKVEMDGSNVSEYYWDRNDIESIVNYCEKDVQATMQVYFRIVDFI